MGTKQNMYLMGSKRTANGAAKGIRVRTVRLFSSETELLNGLLLISKRVNLDDFANFLRSRFSPSVWQISPDSLGEMKVLSKKAIIKMAEEHL